MQIFRLIILLHRIVELLRQMLVNSQAHFFKSEVFILKQLIRMFSSPSNKQIIQSEVQSECLAIHILTTIFYLDGREKSIQPFNTLFRDKALHSFEHAAVRSLEWLSSEKRFLKFNIGKQAFFSFQQVGEIHKKHHQNCPLVHGFINSRFKYPYLLQKIFAFLQQELRNQINSPEVLFVLSALYIQRKINIKSNNCLERLMQLHPEEKAYFLYKYAQNLFQFHQEQKALQYIKQALSIAQSQINEKWNLRLNLRILRAKIYMSQKKYQQAQLEFLSMLHKKQPYEPAYRCCIEYYQKIKNYDRLFLLISDYERIFPESKKLLGLIGQVNIYVNPSKTSRIMKEIEQAILREGENSKLLTKYVNWIGMINLEQPNFERAMEYLKRFTKYYKEERDLYFFNSNSYYLKKYCEVVVNMEQTERSIQKYRADNNLRISIAKAQIELGENKEAQEIITNIELSRIQYCDLPNCIELAQVYSKLDNPRNVLDLIQQLNLQERASRDNRIQHIINIKILQTINLKKMGKSLSSRTMFHQLNKLCEKYCANLAIPVRMCLRLINFLIYYSFEILEFKKGKRFLKQRADLLEEHYQQNEMMLKKEKQLLKERKCEELLW